MRPSGRRFATPWISGVNAQALAGTSSPPGRLRVQGRCQTCRLGGVCACPAMQAAIQFARGSRDADGPSPLSLAQARGRRIRGISGRLGLRPRATGVADAVLAPDLARSARLRGGPTAPLTDLSTNAPGFAVDGCSYLRRGGPARPGFSDAALPAVDRHPGDVAATLGVCAGANEAVSKGRALSPESAANAADWRPLV